MTRASSQSPLSVSQLNARIKNALEEPFRDIWVEGEITDIARPASGHIYLTLKDRQCQVRAVIWRSTAEKLRFALQDGLSVLCYGSVDVYGARGTYQLIIRRVQLQGEGDLQFALKQLQQRLQAAGLFDPDRKKPLPRFPLHIAVVTSPTSAAVRDFLEVVYRRWPGIDVTIVPSRVQGDEAAEELVSAIAAAHRLFPRPDVLVIARGGGSLEDLWCFNDERVVRAIAASQIPTVSAIGHEIDITLSDLASDKRALTPTEAGELVVQSKAALRDEIHAIGAALSQSIQHRFELAANTLSHLSQHPSLTRPHDRINEQIIRVDETQMRLGNAIDKRQQQLADQLRAAATVLDAVGPLKVLARGYTVTMRPDTGDTIKSATELKPGEQLKTIFAHGQITSTVDQIHDESSITPPTHQP